MFKNYQELASLNGEVQMLYPSSLSGSAYPRGLVSWCSDPQPRAQITAILTLKSFPEFPFLNGLQLLSVSDSCNLKDCSPPGPSVHGILQARILEWVAIPFSRGSSRPRDGTSISHICPGRVLNHLSYQGSHTFPAHLVL